MGLRRHSSYCQRETLSIDRKAALSVWRNCNRWVFMYYLMGAVVAVLVIAYSRVAGWEQGRRLRQGSTLPRAKPRRYLS